jgi:NTP pyrophosphatase (non-canonical NTP hydrolase)
MKDKVLEILDELEDDVQAMREEGETDLRTVLHYISTAKYNVRALGDEQMKLNEYQELSARTANKHDNEEVNYALGLTGEAGEYADMIKKQYFHGHEAQTEEKKKELGDLLWYVSQSARAAGLTLEEIAVGNIDKLKRRYPDGFSKEASINRGEE